ncbi:MAG: helix-turn-helix domain-containing protein [Gaiellaceae bacterium]
MNGFTKVPNELLRDTSLSMGARLTWIALKSHAWQGAECWPGQETLAREVGVASRRSVFTYLTELERAGLVKKRRGGNGKSNHYVLTETRWEATCPSADAQMGNHAPMQMGSHVPTKKTQVKKTQRTAPQGRAAHDHASTPAKKLVTDFVNSARAEGLDPKRDLIGRVGREIRQKLDAGDSTDSVREDVDWVVTELLEAGESEDSGHTALRAVFGYTPGRDFKPTARVPRRWKRDVGLTADDIWAQALEAEANEIHPERLQRAEPPIVERHHAGFPAPPAPRKGRPITECMSCDELRPLEELGSRWLCDECRDAPAVVDSRAAQAS